MPVICSRCWAGAYNKKINRLRAHLKNPSRVFWLFMLLKREGENAVENKFESNRMGWVNLTVVPGVARKSVRTALYSDTYITTNQYVSTSFYEHVRNKFDCLKDWNVWNVCKQQFFSTEQVLCSFKINWLFNFVLFALAMMEKKSILDSTGFFIFIFLK